MNWILFTLVCCGIVISLVGKKIFSVIHSAIYFTGLAFVAGWKYLVVALTCSGIVIGLINIFF